MTVTYRKYFASAKYEHDPGFKQVIVRLSRIGMTMAGFLGIIGILIYIGAKVLLFGGSLAWTYQNIDPQEDIILWDKLLIFCLSAMCLVLARLESGPERGRLLMAMLVLVFCVSSLVDDVIVGVSFTPSFLVLFMSIAVGTMPYRPWQTFAFGVLIMVSLGLCVQFLPRLVGSPAMKIDKAVYIFMGIMTIVFTGISALLYTSRYEQYRARRNAERLKKQLEGAHHSLQASYDQLRQTQDQLIHAQKMASLGRVTAGIAHEIKNPLNFVNNFADLVGEQTEELGEVIKGAWSQAPPEHAENVFELINSLRNNATRILKHGRRSDLIVRRMLEHTQVKPGVRELIDVNRWIDQYVTLSYHSMHNEMPDLNIDIERSFDENVGQYEMASREMGQALLNLLNNAFEAVQATAQLQEGAYTPRVTIRSKSREDRIEILIQDNANGIPTELLSKVFEPFFTTRPKGTGLGLSLAYDIIAQRHAGSLSVESDAQEGTTFTISLPRQSHTIGPFEPATTFAFSSV